MLKKSKLSEIDLELVLSIISSKIKFIPFTEFKQFIDKAKKTSPDPNDIEYFALAFKLELPIWSNDKELTKQSQVKIYSTQELLKKLEKEIIDWSVKLQKKSRKGRFEKLKKNLKH